MSDNTYGTVRIGMVRYTYSRTEICLRTQKLNQQIV